MLTKSTFTQNRVLRNLFISTFLFSLAGCLPTPSATKQTSRSVQVISEHLTLGNPSQATTIDADNYLVLKPQFALSFNRGRGIANWVSWHLSPEWKGDAARTKTFRPDPDLPAGYSTVRSSDYERTGFDRGHLCPSEDRDNSPADNAATFVLSNVVPQAPKFNRETWKYLEEFARKQLDTGNEVYIMAGTGGSGGTGEQGEASSLANGKITVPAALWKVLLIMPNGTDDLNRIGPNTQVIAVYMPNQQATAERRWESYRLSVNELEKRTGLRFFTNLPADIQVALKKQTSGGL
ncbi:DNA/RNA non-specific endonuclease [Fibrella aquatica]|jgi:endonuclease G, mitochondrial|uniref:DNA/RNA non-specific endonuclease n=1 Tax=Fibrella aquatica TaxID=3242487 RepID=UPI0035203EB2